MKKSKRAPRRKTAHVPHRRIPAVAPDSQLRQVWLAGLGALAATGETASVVLDELIARGRKQEPATRAAAAKVVREARGAVESVAAQAGRHSKQLMNDAISRLGVKAQPRSRNILHRLGDFAEALL